MDSSDALPWPCRLCGMWIPVVHFFRVVCVVIGLYRDPFCFVSFVCFCGFQWCASMPVSFVWYVDSSGAFFLCRLRGYWIVQGPFLFLCRLYALWIPVMHFCARVVCVVCGFQWCIFFCVVCVVIGLYRDPFCFCVVAWHCVSRSLVLLASHGNNQT